MRVRDVFLLLYMMSFLCVPDAEDALNSVPRLSVTVIFIRALSRAAVLISCVRLWRKNTRCVCVYQSLFGRESLPFHRSVVYNFGMAFVFLRLCV